MTTSNLSGPDLRFWHLTTLLCGMGFAALALFVAMPGLDLWTAGMFFDGTRFPLRSDPGLVALRLFYKATFLAFSVTVALVLLARLVVPDGWRTPLRLWLYFCVLIATGPGLIANLLFKEHWGRARPEAVTAFGGTHPMTLPFAIGDGCVTNCSFVSGEGAAAATLAFALLAAFWPALDLCRTRLLAVAATAFWLLGAALVRIGPGKHFLSDTIFAVVLMGLLATMLYRAFGLRHARKRTTVAAAVRDVVLALLVLPSVTAGLWHGLVRSCRGIRTDMGTRGGTLAGSTPRWRGRERGARRKKASMHRSG